MSTTRRINISTTGRNGRPMANAGRELDPTREGIVSEVFR